LESFEVTLILYLAFGKYISRSIQLVFNSAHEETQVVQVIDSIDLLVMTIHQLIVLIVLLPFLKLRGWSCLDYGLRTQRSDILWGIGFICVLYTWWYIVSPVLLFVYIPVSALENNTAKTIPVVVFSASNSFYEENFFCAYLIVVISRRFSLNVAINVSILIRLSYHLYQEISGLIFIIPMGILFAYWFARTKRLWPLIYAHIFYDI